MILLDRYNPIEGFAKLTDEQIRMINKAIINRIETRSGKKGLFVNIHICFEAMEDNFKSRFKKSITKLKYHPSWFTNDPVIIPDYMRILKND